MLLIDKDLIKDAIVSGILLSLLMIVVYLIWFTLYPEVVQKFWVIENLLGIKLWKIPLEELFWFFSAGMAGGVIYEFWLNVERYPPQKK